MWFPVLLSSVVSTAQAETPPANAGDSSKVRVGVLFGSGLQSNAAAYSVQAAEVLDGAALGSAEKVAPGGSQAGEQGALIFPLQLEARLHRGHLMLHGGFQWGLLASSDETVFLETKTDPGPPDISRQSDTIGSTYDTAAAHRSWWVGAAGVLGQDADMGFGPRIGARWGRSDLPRSQQALASIGWAIQPPVLDSLDPIRPVIDANLYGGVSIPDTDSIALKAASDGQSMFPVVGLDMSVGLMF